MNLIAFLNEWAASEGLRPRDCFDIYLHPHAPALRKQAMNSPNLREEMLDILLNYAGLWEALRKRARHEELA